MGVECVGTANVCFPSETPDMISRIFGCGIRAGRGFHYNFPDRRAQTPVSFKPEEEYIALHRFDVDSDFLYGRASYSKLGLSADSDDIPPPPTRLW